MYYIPLTDNVLPTLYFNNELNTRYQGLEPNRKDLNFGTEKPQKFWKPFDFLHYNIHY